MEIGARRCNEKFHLIKNCIKGDAEGTLGKEGKNPNKPFGWDSDIEDKIERKKEINQQLFRTKIREKYQRINGEDKQQVIKTKNIAWERKCHYI